MNIFNKLILSLLVVVCAVLLSSHTTGAFSLFGDACKPGNGASQGPVCQQNDKQKKAGTNPVAGPNGIINSAVNIIAVGAGVAAVIIIIISGFMFVTAGGNIGGQRAGDNPSRAKNARAALIGAVIGLAIIALAWTIITYVTHNVIKT